MSQFLFLSELFEVCSAAWSSLSFMSLFLILLQIKITVSKEGASGDIPIGIIIGSAIGGLVLLALVTVILWKVLYSS